MTEEGYHHLTQARATSTDADLGYCHPPTSVHSTPFLLIICSDLVCWAGAKGLSQISVPLFCASMKQSSISMADNGNIHQFKRFGFALRLPLFPCQAVIICSRVAVNIKYSAS